MRTFAFSKSLKICLYILKNHDKPGLGLKLSLAVGDGGRAPINYVYKKYPSVTICIGGYTVVNVFSHASADSTATEPRLYMQDAAINLSELQLNNKPAARLVVLSACQTNVGKNATGEGIYSQARGFSSAGTLWNADEDMIYEISSKFHNYLSQGMIKDIVLRSAKFGFLKSHAGSEKSLPYYWANLVMIGNTEPLALSAGINKWWWVAGSGIALIAGVVFAIKRRQQPAANI